MIALNRRPVIVFCFGAVFALHIASSPTHCESDDRKAVIPDADALDRAKRLVHEIYGDEISAATSAEIKATLAGKIFEQAINTTNDINAQYVLYLTARDIAVAASDIDLALKIVDQMERRFDFNPLRMKIDCVLRIGRQAKRNSEYLAVARQAFQLMDMAAEGDDYESAESLAKVAATAARKGRDYRLANAVSDRSQRIDAQRRAYQSYRKSLLKLEQEPLNSEANGVAGTYLCVIKNEWETGIPMLALGTDADLKVLATKELSADDTPDMFLMLGDEWWNLASRMEGSEKRAFLRAAHWYRKTASTHKSELVKVKSEKRLQEIHEMTSKDPVSCTGIAARIMDSGDAGFRATAGWTAQKHPRNYGGEYHYAPAGNGGENAAFAFSDLPNRRYQVWTTWISYSNRATNAPVAILDGKRVLTKVNINQRVPPRDLQKTDGANWHSLGVFNIKTGTLVVVINDRANGFVNADAVRIECIEN